MANSHLELGLLIRHLLIDEHTVDHLIDYFSAVNELGKLEAIVVLVRSLRALESLHNSKSLVQSP